MTSPRRVARRRGMQSLELKPQKQRVRMPRRAPVGPPKMGGPLPPTRVPIRPKRPPGGATPLNPITGRPQPIQFTTPPSRPRIPPPQQGFGLADTLTQEQHQALIKAQTDLYNKRMQDPEFQRQQKLMLERMNKQIPLREQFLKGEITVKDLKGSGLFTPQQLREARRNRRMQRMSPEERLNFMRREAERRKRRLGRRRRPLGLGTANRPLKPKPQRPRRVMPRRGMQSLELRPQRRRVRRRVR